MRHRDNSVDKGVGVFHYAPATNLNRSPSEVAVCIIIVEAALVNSWEARLHKQAAACMWALEGSLATWHLVLRGLNNNKELQLLSLHAPLALAESFLVSRRHTSVENAIAS